MQCTGLLFLFARALLLLAVCLGMQGLAWTADTETVLHTFTGGADGGQPFAGLVFDKAGNLYGTASAGALQNCKVFGGTLVGCGVVFELSPVGGQWQFTVLYTFTGGGDGGVPFTGLIFDNAGHLYGTTSYGGDLTCSIALSTGCGTVFELTAGAGGVWTETVLHSFTGIDGDGIVPSGGLSFDSAGNLYGTTAYGGSPVTGAGTVFRLTRSSSGWKESVYSINETSDGEIPQCATLDAAGNVYVDTYAGGAGGWGTIFELHPISHGWKKTVLHSFSYYPDGAAPTGCLTVDAVGNVYGTTQQNPKVFKLSRTPVGKWVETVLYGFSHQPGDGNFPSAGVTFDDIGNLYGTCEGGGNSDAGLVFQLTPRYFEAGQGKENILYSFTGQSDGSLPAAPLTLDSAGNLYGTTYEGGASGCSAGCGVIFEISP
jgi:uncharacterized repeat protein (TIGR03803 family)